jgi:prolyl 4-hydroxylase
MNGFDTTIENVFTVDEMEDVINSYKNKIKPTVIFGSGETQLLHVDKKIRDALGYFIRDPNPVVDRFKQLTSAITGLPIKHQESPNFVKYKKGGFYKPHFDGFNDSESGQKSIKESGQRMFSSILYLNDDFDGGETVFPKIDKIIKPSPGKVHIWRNAFEDLKLDQKSLHAGNPVESGVKYVIVIWVRSNIIA